MIPRIARNFKFWILYCKQPRRDCSLTLSKRVFDARHAEYSIPNELRCEVTPTAGMSTSKGFFSSTERGVRRSYAHVLLHFSCLRDVTLSGSAHLLAILRFVHSDFSYCILYDVSVHSALFHSDSLCTDRPRDQPDR